MGRDKRLLLLLIEAAVCDLRLNAAAATHEANQGGWLCNHQLAAYEIQARIDTLVAEYEGAKALDTPEPHRFVLDGDSNAAIAFPSAGLFAVEDSSDVCRWTRNYLYDQWETVCGWAWSIAKGLPPTVCHGCGKRVEVAR